MLRPLQTIPNARPSYETAAHRVPPPLSWLPFAWPHTNSSIHRLPGSNLWASYGILFRFRPVAQTILPGRWYPYQAERRHHLALSPLLYRFCQRNLFRWRGIFEVSKNSSHPFIVRSPVITTIVLGTSFNIKSSGNQGLSGSIGSYG